MNKLNFDYPGKAPLFFEDFIFLQNSYIEVIKSILKGISFDNGILFGCEMSGDGLSISEGAVVIAGEVYIFSGKIFSTVPAVAGLYFEKNTEYDVSGDRNFMDGTVNGTINQVFQLNSAIITENSSPQSLQFENAPNFADILKNIQQNEYMNTIINESNTVTATGISIGMTRATISINDVVIKQRGDVIKGQIRYRADTSDGVDYAWIEMQLNSVSDDVINSASVFVYNDLGSGVKIIGTYEIISNTPAKLRFYGNFQSGVEYVFYFSKISIK